MPIPVITTVEMIDIRDHDAVMVAVTLEGMDDVIGLYFDDPEMDDDSITPIYL